MFSPKGNEFLPKEMFSPKGNEFLPKDMFSPIGDINAYYNAKEYAFQPFKVMNRSSVYRNGSKQCP